MSHESFTSFLNDHGSTINIPNGRAKRTIAESRDPTAKRRCATGVQHESFFVSNEEEEEGADDEVARVSEYNKNANWSSTANVDNRMNGRSNPGTTLTQTRPHAPASATSIVKDSNATSLSQSKAASTVNGAASPRKKTLDAEIKDEPEKPNIPCWVEQAEEIDRIRIYIGKRQRQTFATRDDLAKSPILTEYIVEDAEQGPYIMRPQLLRTDPNDFDAVLQFIHTGTFEPLVTGQGDEARFGNMTSDYEHGREMVRLGKIYMIAQMFNVQGLEDAIYNKVCAVPARRYPNKFLVELASVIFSDKRVGKSGHATSGSTPSLQTGQDDKDKFEEWIITSIATNFQDIQKYVHDDFWAVEKKTTKKMFYAQVLELAAEIYRANSGKLPEPAKVVELE